MKATGGGNSGGFSILKSWMSEIEKSVLENAVKHYKVEGTCTDHYAFYLIMNLSMHLF